MRDPLTRLWSHTRFHLALTGKLTGLAEWKEADFGAFLSLPEIALPASYARVLAMLEQSFDPEHYHLVVYEEIKTAPQSVLAGIETFLGITPGTYDHPSLARRHNRGPKHPMPPAFIGAARRLVDEELASLAALGFAFPAAWQNAAFNNSPTNPHRKLKHGAALETDQVIAPVHNPSKRANAASVPEPIDAAYANPLSLIEENASRHPMTQSRKHELERHENTWLTLEETAVDRRFSKPFVKTFRYSGDFINKEHFRIASCSTKQGMIDLGIEGWLLVPDALKLYEMVYFSQGDVLELGTYRGLSTSIIAEASSSATLNNVIVTVDLDPAAIATARKNLLTRSGGERVHYFVFDAVTFVENLASAGRKFEFCFIDHSHTYEHVLMVCQNLDKIIVPGGFCLFHDFNDPRNFSPSVNNYGVYQGVTEGLSGKSFEFWGIYGCTGLYRRTIC